MFQIVQHLGSTYKQCVQESPNGDIVLQRNNRIYAGKKPSGLIVKVKPNGRRDSLANCPPNPIVDNANKCTINDINKRWYIKLAKQWANDFKGVKRLEDYKKEELLQKATELGLEVDKKTKKSDLIKIIEEEMDKQEVNENPLNEQPLTEEKKEMNIYEKLNAIKKEIREMQFILDTPMPNSLGGKDYASIGQYYRALNDLSIKYNLLFTWDVESATTVERDLFKPQGKMPQHVITVSCLATFVNTENPTECLTYKTMASGSDSCDKMLSAASSMAFRNWFDKNFTPKHLTIDEYYATDTEVAEKVEQTSEPKVPAFIPATKKIEVTKEVVAEKDIVAKDSTDIQEVVSKIMEVRALLGDENWATNTLQRLMTEDISSEDLMEMSLKIDNKLDSLK